MNFRVAQRSLSATQYSSGGNLRNGLAPQNMMDNNVPAIGRLRVQEAGTASLVLIVDVVFVQGKVIMEFAVIDCNLEPMNPGNGRGRGFVQALDSWTLGKEYELVRYDHIPSRIQELLKCRGLILSGSAFDLALSNGRFDRVCYQTMIPMYRLMREIKAPVLGICFGHQLMALGDEFDPDRTDFGELRISNMLVPRIKHCVALVRMKRSLRFMAQRDLWVQFNHKQEVMRNDGLLKYYNITGSSELCAVEMMEHKTREWFGVQFHPEIGKETQTGEIGQHDAAIRDGKLLMQEFVRYCLLRK
jgi:GMP synthase-like glutamine amidotransferase